jgi:hypothetical protein
MIPIPPLDPAPVPAPIWLLKALLYVTFFVHVVLMNLILGGSLMAVYYGFKGQEKHIDAAGILSRMLPWAMPFTITFGVAPLLFVQVIYGPLFYAASIPMGVPFLMIIPVVIAAYYMMYYNSWRYETLGSKRPWIALAIFGLLGYVGFTYSNVFTLMLDPDRIHSKYLAHPDGFQMNLLEPTLLPRFLHMFLGAVAVSGLYMAFMGLKKLQDEPERGRWMYRSGATWFSGATLVSIAVGIWWLLALPDDQMKALMGGSLPATIAFGVGFLTGIGSFVFVLWAMNSSKPKRYFVVGKILVVVTLLCMIFIRDQIRDAGISSFFKLADLPVAPQWGVLSLFLVIFVLGLVVVYWLIKAFLAPPPPSPEDSAIGRA